jgi:hypothetical protein
MRNVAVQSAFFARPINRRYSGKNKKVVWAKKQGWPK